MEGQPNLNTILTALNQLQLDNQILHQENADFRDVLNQLRFLNQIRLVIRMQPNRYPDDRTQKLSELLDDFETLVQEFKQLL
ncbi:23244_t:CDS:2, partial [Racocetra persica]